MSNIYLNFKTQLWRRVVSIFNTLELPSPAQTASLAAAAAIMALVVPGKAAAGWESIHSPPRKADRNCSTPHNQKADLLASENRPLVVPNGADVELEIYGHGLDLVTNVRGTGPVTASRVDGVGGGFNGARGCGNIGSLIVRLKVPASTTAQTARLWIGNEHIDLSIETPSLTRVQWSDATLQGTRIPTTAGGGNGGSTPRPITVQKGTGCGQGGAGCNSSHGAVIPSGGRSGASGLPSSPPNSIGGCITDFAGGRAELESAGQRLVVTLPVERNGRYTECLSRPLLVSFESTHGRTDLPTSNAPPGTGGTRRLPSIPAYSVAPQGQGVSAPAPLTATQAFPDLREVRIDPGLATGFVGQRLYRLRARPGSPAAANPIELVLRSEPANGIAQAKQILFHPSVGRTSSTLTVHFTLQAAAPAGGQAIDWRVSRPGNAQAGDCFAQVAGQVTVAANRTEGSVSLRVRENAGCYGNQIHLTLTIPGGPVQAPFGHEQTFTLPPLTTLRTPPPAPAATGGGVRVPGS